MGGIELLLRPQNSVKRNPIKCYTKDTKLARVITLKVQGITAGKAIKSGHGGSAP